VDVCPAVDALAFQVDLDLAERDDSFSPAGGCSGAAGGGPEPGEEFGHAEGFGDVVVCAGVERGDLVVGVRAGGEHDDRDGGPAAQARDDLRAVEVGRPRSSTKRSGCTSPTASRAARPVPAVLTW
jgi:hypothetical protein